MKSLLLAATAGATLVLSACTTNSDTVADAPVAAAPVADAPTVAAPGALTSAPTYLQMAGSSDQYEIQSSQLAMQMSQNPAVRSMAQMLIADHTRTSSELMAASQAASISLPPPALAPHHAQMLDQLRSAGTNFDVVYRDQQIMAHQEALNLQQTYATGGDIQPLRAVAASAVPVIQTHLQHAQTMTVQSAPIEPTTTDQPRAGERG